jgi:hypothetical protein
MVARLVIGLICIVLVAPSAYACSPEYRRRPCGQGEGYTCRQKSMDMDACDRSQAQRAREMRQRREAERAKQ